MIPIHLSDLLQRRERVLDTRPVKQWLSGKRVAITGVGYIGLELAKQVAAFDPASVLLVDNCEHNLWKAGRSVPGATAAFGDVRDELRMRELLRGADIVFHAAAMKHVPICEDNKYEAWATNVDGTRNVVNAAGAARVVLVSTDKAVAPTTTLGTTKMHAERMARVAKDAVVVRFGNVIGSTGSVVPLWMEQIQAGGPVTVTDPGMTRYMMTVSEAAELILQAGAAGSGTYVLDMGEPVSMDELARNMVRLSGRRDVDIVYTGVRSGEKLSEVLSTGPLVASGIDGVYRVNE